MGKIIPIGDDQALADAIIQIIANPNEYQGSPQKVKQQFDPLVNAAIYDQIYTDLLGNIP